MYMYVDADELDIATCMGSGWASYWSNSHRCTNCTYN